MDGCQNDPKNLQQPTIDDIIEWHHEQSLCLAETGYSTRFPTADFFATDPFPDTTFSDFNDPDILQSAVEDLSAEYQRVINRMEYMKANKPLLIETENEVHRRLLKAGRTEKDIGRYISKGDSLREKIEDLYKVEHRGSESAKNTIIAYIYYGSGFNKRSVKINLPVHGSLAEFRGLVKVYMGCIKDVNEPLNAIYYNDRLWKYQFKSKMKSVKADEKLRPLEIERDYTNLIRQMMSPGSAAFSVVLTQEDWPDRRNAHKERVQKYEKKQDSALQDCMEDGMDSLFEDVNLLNDLEMLGRGQIQFANEKALEELAAAGRALTAKQLERSRAVNGQRRANRDKAKRAQSPNNLVPGYGHQSRRDSRGASQGQAASPSRRSHQVAEESSTSQISGTLQGATTATSTLATQNRRASGAGKSTSSPRMLGNAGEASPTAAVQHAGSSLKERIRFPQEDRILRNSITRFYPSKK